MTKQLGPANTNPRNARQRQRAPTVIHTPANVRMALPQVTTPQNRVANNHAGLNALGRSSAMGRTDDGRRWAMAALHPCGETTLSQFGLPDMLTASVATPDYRMEYNLNWDPTMFGTPTPTTTGNYDVQIISLGIPEIAFIYRIRDIDGNRWSSTRVVRLPGFDNPATATAASFRKGVTLGSIGYSKSRITGKGLTLELNAGSLNDYGRIVSGQISFETAQATIPIFTGAADATHLVPQAGDTEAHVTHLIVPNTEQFVVSQCPAAYQHEARHGAYIVHKFDSPLTSYQMVDSGLSGEESLPGALGQTGNFASPRSFMTMSYGDGIQEAPNNDSSFTTDSYYVLPTSATDTTTGVVTHDLIHPYITAPNGLLGSCTFVLGIAKGSTTTQGASIRVKVREFLECLSSGSASISPFVHRAPMLDNTAISNAVQVMQMMPDAYPSSYNGFGDIFSTLWGGLKKVLEPISSITRLPFIRSIPGVGVANDIYSAAKGILDPLTGHPVVSGGDVFYDAK